MVEIFTYILSTAVQSIGLFVAYVFAAIFIFLVLRKLHSLKVTIALLIVFLGASIFFYAPVGLPNGLAYPFFLKTYGPAEGPVLPLKNIVAFFKHFDDFERVSDIARDPNDVPMPIERVGTTTVQVTLTAKEVVAEMAPGVFMNYWTYDGTVPGPMIRVREGDVVVLTLKNHPTSLHHHNIDLHAVTGPGGGAVSTNVAPGEEKTFTFQALHPGTFVYHCAHPNVASHMTHGMYGLIVVEPAEGMARVDKEFYVMQGEFYTTGALGRKGLQIFDGQAMLDGKPQYVVFNGRVGGLNDKMAMSTDQTARYFVGNGGVNLVSSFHLIGEVFDRVFPEGAIRDPYHDVQTTLIPAGGASVVEFDTQVPGNYVLVDHALARLERGAWGVMRIEGEENEAVYQGEISAGGGH